VLEWRGVKGRVLGLVLGAKEQESEQRHVVEVEVILDVTLESEGDVWLVRKKLVDIAGIGEGAVVAGRVVVVILV
jgi:hypothetical protein